jgi:4-hydroxy-tetrahydrodipicolinate reductase
MGRAVLEVLAAEAATTAIGAALVRPGSQQVGRDVGAVLGRAPLGVTLSTDVRQALAAVDAVIDFSSPGLTVEVVEAARSLKRPVVVGTTGLDAAARAAVERAANEVPMVLAPNMSLGVAVLTELCERAARALGPGFDLEIVEVHHRKKKDAPSGTALALGEAVARATGEPLATRARYGREGAVGARTDDEIGVLGVRGGDVVGDHTVHFLGLGERLELTHRATSRETFARGAVRAALFLCGRKPGLYSMRDVLAG